MAKLKVSKSTKIKFYANLYSDEFDFHPSEHLWCKLCQCFVSCDKKDHVEAHRKTKKHTHIMTQAIENDGKFKDQTFLTLADDEFTEKIVCAFASADIPLSKLNNEKLQDLFKFLGRKLVPESTARLYLLNNFAKKLNSKLKEYLQNEKIFIIMDESEINGTKYFNLLAGRINAPNVNFVLDVYVLPENTSMDSNLVISILNRNITAYGLNINDLVLIVTDAARYMTKACKDLKTINPNFFHVTCLAHLVHNCAMRIKAFYTAVDHCISSVKAITVKNRRISSLFSIIGKPPSVIVTRWSSWLKAAIYYSNNLVIVRKIVNEIGDEGILIKRAKEAVNDKKLHKDLISITSNYRCLIDVLDRFETSEVDMKTGYEMIHGIDFLEDPVELKNYVINRLSVNDIKKLLTLQNEMIAPTTYAYLKKCLPTSIPAERSFSMLKKLLNYDRNFKDSNIYSYFSYYYNRFE